MFVCSMPLSFDEGNLLPQGTYRLTSNGKLKVETPRATAFYVAFAGVQPQTQDITHATFYGSTGPRSSSGSLSGARLDDLHLKLLYNVLVEDTSYIRVDP